MSDGDWILALALLFFIVLPAIRAAGRRGERLEEQRRWDEYDAKYAERDRQEHEAREARHREIAKSIPPMDESRRRALIKALRR